MRGARAGQSAGGSEDFNVFGGSDDVWCTAPPSFLVCVCGLVLDNNRFHFSSKLHSASMQLTLLVGQPLPIGVYGDKSRPHSRENYIPSYHLKPLLISARRPTSLFADGEQLDPASTGPGRLN